MISVGEALRIARNKKGWTIERTCREIEKIGVKISQSSLASYELGRRGVSNEKLEMLCSIYRDELPILVYNASLDNKQKCVGEHVDGFNGVLSECSLHSVAGYLYQYYGREVFSQLLDEMQRVKDVSI